MSATQPAAQFELLLERNYPLTRETVFRAWTDERQLARWFGPLGYSITRCVLDPRVGGGVHIEMKAPDGTVYPLTGQVKEIQPPQLLEFTTVLADEDGPPLYEMLQTITLVEAPGGTLLVWHAKLLNAKLGAAAYLEGYEVACIQTLEHLRSHLAEQVIR